MSSVGVRCCGCEEMVLMIWLVQGLGVLGLLAVIGIVAVHLRRQYRG